jgi:hypothetical protein
VEIDDLKKRMAALEALQTLQLNKADPAFLHLIIETLSGRRLRYKILSDSRATEIFFSMMSAGCTVKEVTATLNTLGGFKIGKSAINRFWKKLMVLGLHKIGSRK